MKQQIKDELVVLFRRSGYKLYTERKDIDDNRTKLYFFISVEGEEINISKEIALLLHYDYKDRSDCIIWHWKGEQKTFKPEVWICGRLSKELYSEKHLLLSKLKTSVDEN